MTKRKQILFIKRSSEASNLKFHYLDISSLEIITLEPEPEEILEKMNVPFTPAESFLDKDLLKDVDLQAKEFAANCFDVQKNASGIKPFLYDGIELGSLIYRESSYYFAEVIRTVLTIKGVLDSFRPADIILFREHNRAPKRFILAREENLYIRTALSLAAAYGIRTEIIDNLSAEDAERKRERPAIKTNSVALFILNVLNKLIRFLDDRKTSRILFFMPWKHIDLVIEELKGRKGYRVMFLSDTPCISGRLVRKGIPQVYISEYLDERIRLKIRDYSIDLKAIWQELKKDEKFKGQFVFKGISLWDILEERFEFLFLEYFPAVAVRIELTKKIISRERVKLVVVSNDVNTFQKTIVSAANASGVKTLVIQHGAMTHSLSFVPMTADRIAVWGEFNKRFMIKAGEAEEKVVITGCPRFDKYFNIDTLRLKVDFYRQLGFDNGSGIFVLVAEGRFGFRGFANCHFSNREIANNFKAVISAMRHFPRHYLCVKTRQNDKVAELARKTAADMRLSNIRVLWDVDLVGLLASAELVMGFRSTILLEGIILGKPVISLDITGKKDTWQFVDRQMAVGVRRAEDLPSAIQEVVNSPRLREKLSGGRRKFLDDYIFKQDGWSSKRVAHLIREMVDNEKAHVT